MTSGRGEEQENNGQLLVICLDIHPVWWGRRRDVTLSEVIQNVLILANAHIVQNPLNKLAVYGYHNTEVYKLYPDKTCVVEGSSASGKYEGIDKINTSIMLKIQDIICGITNSDAHRHLNGSQMSVSLLKALCYCNTVTSDLNPGTKLIPRLLFVKGSPDNYSNYMAMMNGIFAAQKGKIGIDACVIGDDSVFLQQACDITGGTYVKLEDGSEIGEYLLGIFLMSIEFRKSFNIPIPEKVDFRAGCQCHSKMVDIGYVCSVCMSVYCSFRPICMTCNAHFKLPTATLLKAKKSVKRKENGKT